MKVIIILIFFLFLNAVALFAQPAIQWQKSFGGTKDDYLNVGNSSHENIQPTADGGFIFAGTSYSNDIDVTGHHGNTVQSDYWIVKLDSFGNLDWQKSLGGSLEDCAYSLIQTSDGGYIVAGSSKSYDGDVTGHHGNDTVYDAWIVKLDVSGSIQWNKCYGGSLIDEANFIQQTVDGGYIFSGYTTSVDGDVSGNHSGNGSDFWVVKLDSAGTIEWQKCLGGTRSEESYCIRQTTDTGFIVTGKTLSYDGDVIGNNDHILWNVWVVKLNTTGSIQWQHAWGGSYEDHGIDIQQTFDGGYILGCQTYSSDGNVTGNHGANSSNNVSDYWVIKLNASGNIVWKKCYGGTYYETFYCITQTNDGGYIMSGSAYSTDGDITFNHGKDSWIVKIDSIGTIQWQQCYGGTEEDNATGIIQTTDGGYVFINDSKSNNGDVSGHHGSLLTNDFWVVKLAPFLIGIDEIKTPISSFTFFPNPSYVSVNFKFYLEETNIVVANIYDLAGREIKNLLNERLNNGSHILNWNLLTNNNQPAENGMYVISISAGEFSLSKTFNLFR